MLDVDGYMNQLGQFGKFQAYAYGLSLLPAVLSGIIVLQNVFLLGRPDHRCRIPGCDPPLTETALPSFMAEWVSGVIPLDDKSKNCYRYPSTTNITSGKCYGNVDNETDPFRCDHGYIYDRKDFDETAITEVTFNQTQMN